MAKMSSDKAGLQSVVAQQEEAYEQRKVSSQLMSCYL